MASVRHPIHVIEAARNLVGIADANSTEFGPTSEPLVGLMTEWLRDNELEKRSKAGDLGGTMRLGAYPATLARGSLGRTPMVRGPMRRASQSPPSSPARC